MKKEIVYKILRKIESDKDLKRKLKIFAVVGIVGILLISAITVWIGFKAVNYVATKTKEAGQVPIVQGYAQNINSELKTLSKNQVVSCWDKAQDLITIQAWIERSAIDNLMDLKVACLDNNSSSTQNLNIPKNRENNQLGELYDSGKV